MMIAATTNRVDACTSVIARFYHMSRNGANYTTVPAYPTLRS
jgi:hypothetical protein